MPIEIIVLIAAILVTWLVFSWLVNVVKASLQTAVTIAAIVLALQIIFGIGPTHLWDTITNLPQIVMDQFGQGSPEP